MARPGWNGSVVVSAPWKISSRLPAGLRQRRSGRGPCAPRQARVSRARTAPCGVRDWPRKRRARLHPPPPSRRSPGRRPRLGAPRGAAFLSSIRNVAVPRLMLDDYVPRNRLASAVQSSRFCCPEADIAKRFQAHRSAPAELASDLPILYHTTEGFGGISRHARKAWVHMEWLLGFPRPIRSQAVAPTSWASAPPEPDVSVTLRITCIPIRTVSAERPPDSNGRNVHGHLARPELLLRCCRALP